MAQCAFRNLPVIGDGKAAVWRLLAPENDVAARLMIFLVADFCQGFG